MMLLPCQEPESRGSLTSHLGVCKGRILSAFRGETSPSLCRDVRTMLWTVSG